MRMVAAFRVAGIASSAGSTAQADECPVETAGASPAAPCRVSRDRRPRHVEARTPMPVHRSQRAPHDAILDFDSRTWRAARRPGALPPRCGHPDCMFFSDLSPLHPFLARCSAMTNRPSDHSTSRSCSTCCAQTIHCPTCTTTGAVATAGSTATSPSRRRPGRSTICTRHVTRRPPDPIEPHRDQQFRDHQHTRNRR